MPTGLGAGAKSSVRVVYVFLDPGCPYRNALWRALLATRAPKVQVRYLLVAVIDADSRGKKAATIESSDPAATLARQERSFDCGGILPKARSHSGRSWDRPTGPYTVAWPMSREMTIMTWGMIMGTIATTRSEITTLQITA